MVQDCGGCLFIVVHCRKGFQRTGDLVCSNMRKSTDITAGNTREYPLQLNGLCSSIKRCAVLAVST